MEEGAPKRAEQPDATTKQMMLDPVNTGRQQFSHHGNRKHGRHGESTFNPVALGHDTR